MKRVINLAERVLAVLVFLPFLFANLRSGDWIDWAVTALEAMTVVFILIPRGVIDITERPMDWLVAVCGTMLPMFPRPGGVGYLPEVAGVLVVAGIVLSFGAKLSLNRRFGLVPANRGVQSNWAYRLVRHPMYLGYIIAQIGYLLHNFSAANLALYLAAWGFQLARASREERLLRDDPDYVAYARRVRYRLLPGLY